MAHRGKRRRSDELTEDGQEPMESIAIEPVGPLRASIRPPGSKSLTNRALVCAAFAAGASDLRGALASEDTRVMIDSLQRLGIAIQPCEPDGLCRVTGCAGEPPVKSGELFIANSGTTMRFLAAMLSAVGGSYRLDGVPRMRERPAGDLIRALESLGVSIRGELRPDCPPLRIESSGWTGTQATVRGDVSSQFLSGLLMAAPLARRDVELVVEGPLVSQPYVTMTRRVMEAFGVAVVADVGEEKRTYRIAAPTTYRACPSYAIEPDASAASYFWAAAAVTGGRVRVEGLFDDSMQGDVAFCDCLRRMGCSVRSDEQGIEVRGGPLHGIDADMNSISDTAQTLAVVALFAEGPTRLRGIAHVRHKETDRIADLARELRKLGADVREHHDGLTIVPGTLHGAVLDTYRDHRMAMSLALVGLRQPGIVIRDPACVDKTYPNFFRDLERCRTGHRSSRHH